MKTQNVTLALPVQLLRKVKAMAAERGSSMSSVLRRALEREVEADVDYRRAMAEDIEDMERGHDLGTGGKATWTRDELHERR